MKRFSLNFKILEKVFNNKIQTYKLTIWSLNFERFIGFKRFTKSNLISSKYPDHVIVIFLKLKKKQILYTGFNMKHLDYKRNK